MNLHVVFATANILQAEPLIHTMTQCLPEAKISFYSLLIGHRQIDCSADNMIDERVSIIGTFQAYLPIHESRNICQKHLKALLEELGGIGLVLDDDLLWTISQDAFNQIVDQLISQKCDMAFSALEGDTPIPKEYTRASALLDVLKAVQSSYKNHTSHSTNSFLRGVNFLSTEELLDTETIKQYLHHDYYAYSKESFRAVGVSINALDWFEFFQRMHLGKSTTRETLTPDEIYPATGRERGGATLVFNPKVLDISHVALTTKRWVSRRSDMLMGVKANQLGFHLCNTPPMLKHERKLSFDTHGSRKLIGDMLGYALVESVQELDFSCSTFDLHLENRIGKTISIIKDTNRMLTCLRQDLDNMDLLSNESAELISLMIRENVMTLQDIQSLNIKDFSNAFSVWEKNQNSQLVSS